MPVLVLGVLSFVGILLSLVILMQSKGSGLGAAFGGGGEFYSTKRGAEDILYKATIGLGIVFLVIALIYPVFAPNTPITAPVTPTPIEAQVEAVTNGEDVKIEATEGRSAIKIKTSDGKERMIPIDSIPVETE